MTEKQYAKLLNEISAGPISKHLLFEIVERDGRRFLFTMKDTLGKWYPCKPDGGSDDAGYAYVQVIDGRPVAALKIDEVAILTPRKSFFERAKELFKTKGPQNEIDLGSETGSP